MLRTVAKVKQFCLALRYGPRTQIECDYRGEYQVLDFDH